ncbi:MAG TPA: VOC family protein [Chitinophagaceae bacterium]|jgi:predicted 3-demethylubiquinone-9 3-methyltransferase (glyoxalase superfamily)|nr:VOC family protein [Chitinophagaceae bacterium]
MMATKQKITYCLWFNKEASEVVDFYVSVFKQAKKTDVVHNPIDTPSGKTGTVLTASFNLEGQEFMVLNGGPEFTVNPSVSFMVHCETVDEVDALWEKLSGGGKVRMPLDSYPFSKRYGWIEDKYGVSWQLILPQGKAPQKIMPSMMFVNKVYGKAEEAIGYYTSIFHQAASGTLARYPAGMEPDREGTIMFGDFTLEGQWFAVMDSAREHDFDFSEAISFVVHCDTQDEIDYYWGKLTAGGEEVQCGWLKDKYGLSWQVAPAALPRLIQGEDTEKSKRVMQALMDMVKLDIAQLEQA